MSVQFAGHPGETARMKILILAGALAVFGAEASAQQRLRLPNDLRCHDIEDCVPLVAWLEETLATARAKLEERRSPPAIAKIASGLAFSRVDDEPQLGLAWRDPSGTIWGDAVKDGSGRFARMTLKEASAYCASINARLPSAGDFERLRKYLGGNGPWPYPMKNNYQSFRYGYQPQILPHLAYFKFVTSTTEPGNPEYYLYKNVVLVWTFDTSVGLFSNTDIESIHTKFSVRCVR